MGSDHLVNTYLNKMDSCVICLEVASDFPPCINIDSNEWQKCNAKRVIEKHLWWWHLRKLRSKQCSYICGQCWKMLSSFHAFYLKVKKVHQQYDAIDWPILKRSIVKEKSYGKELHSKSKIMRTEYKNITTNNTETRFLTCSKSFEKISPEEDIEKLNATKSPSKTKTTLQYDEYIEQSGYQFNCDLCNITLKCFTEIKSHYREEHDVSGYAVCCKKKFYSRGQFTDHLRIHRNPNYFKCSFCSKVLSHRSSYQNHLKSHKLPQLNLECRDCKKCFSRKDDYDQHILLHSQDDTTTTFSNMFRNTANPITNNIAAEEILPVTNYEITTSSENNQTDEGDHYTDIIAEKATNNDETVTNVCRNYVINELQNPENKEHLLVVKSEISEDIGQLYSDNCVDDNFEPSLNRGESNCISIPKSVIYSENGEIFNYSFIEESAGGSNYGETQSCEVAISNSKNDVKCTDEQLCNVDEDYLKHMKYTVSCQLCTMSFTNFTELKTHCRLEHDINGYALCCKKKIYNSKQFANHLKLHKKPNYFKCTICNRVFRRHSTYETHIQSHKTQQKEDYCNICGEIFFEKTFLYQHQSKMHAKEMRKEQICAYCSKVSPNMYALRAHIRYNHTKGLRHACHLCEKKFNRPFHLREHLSTHTGVALHACPYCSRPFNSVANMHTHRKRVHRKEWEEERINRLMKKN